MDKITWVQRNVSPLATRIYSVAYLDRRMVAWGIQSVVRSLDEKQMVTLRLYLNKHGIIQQKFQGIDLKTLESYHISKVISNKRLARAADEFFRISGKESFLSILPEIMLGKLKGPIDIKFAQAQDYAQVLSAAKQRILSAVQSTAAGENTWQNEVVNQAFNLVMTGKTLAKNDLVYRMLKMADLTDDIQPIVATAFMDLPEEEMGRLFSVCEGKELYALRNSIIKIVQNYQELYRNFRFDRRYIRDSKYIYVKMSELLTGAKTPEVLLLFFLKKLSKARSAAGPNETIFDEIRFLYAPLAERLGLIYLADDFRDQHLRLSSKKKYEEIEAQVAKRLNMGYESAKTFLSLFLEQLKEEFRNHPGIDFTGAIFKFRVKSPYSINNKTKVRQEYTIDEIKDILGLKIIVNSKETMKAIRDALKKSASFIVKPDGIKEEIGETGPVSKWRGIKMEGADPSGIPIEIQIMTHAMNQENNCGRAATWKYNLKKELGEAEQEFDLLEPKEVITSSFAENFYRILNFWI